jgi:hypothetical protein
MVERALPMAIGALPLAIGAPPLAIGAPPLAGLLSAAGTTSRLTATAGT